MRKQIFVALTVIICCMLTSCIPQQPQTTKGEERFTTITLAVRSGEQSGLANMITNFENKNPDIKVKVTELGSSLEQYRLITAAFSSEEYLFDVVEIEDVWVNDFVNKGYIVPLEKSISDDGYIPIVKESFVRNDKTYAIPFKMDIGMMFSLKKYQWNGDFTSLAGSAANDKERARAANYEREDILCGLMELIEYSNGDVCRALELYRDIYYGKENEGLGIEEFKKKEVPIMRAWSSVLPLLRNETSSVANEFNAHNMPKSDSGEVSAARLYGLAISKISDKKAACERFVEYCGDNESQIELIKETGTYPMKKELYDAPSINSQWGHISAMKERVEAVQLRPHINSYVEQENNLQTYLAEYMDGLHTAKEAEQQVNEFLNKDKK